MAERQNKHNLPLPKTCHLVLDEQQVTGKTVFIIGDVHGCNDEMCELMARAKHKNENVLFIFVGDMINKGPKNVEVLHKIREMQREVYAVRGNHEESVLREIRSFKENENHELREKYKWIKDLTHDDTDYIQELPYTISIPSLKVLVVHAGLLPNQPLESQRLYNFTNMRNVIVKDGASTTEELEGVSKTYSGHSWTSYWTGPDHVYFGHDARRGLQLCEFATGLDTGCVVGGYLTGAFVNGTRERIQVKSKQPQKFNI